MTRLLRRNIWIELGISLFLSGLFLFTYLNMDNWVIEAMPSTISPAFFPTLTALLLFLFSLTLTGLSLLAVRHMLSGEIDDERLHLQEAGEQAGRFLALGGYILVMFLYLIGMYYVGFVISTPLVMLAVALMLGIRRWLLGLACYVAFTLALNYASFHFMQIILPSGVLFE